MKTLDLHKIRKQLIKALDSKRYEHLISKLSPTKFQGVLDEFI